MPDITTGSSYNPTVVLYFIILHTKSEWEFNMDKEIYYNIITIILEKSFDLKIDYCLGYW